MTALEIILLLIGIICVAVSFIFFMKADGPEAVAAKVNVGLSDKQKEDIRQQISRVFEEEIEDMTEEVRGRTEGALEKLSNQKIQEFSDYSDTILSEINKNHTEVMFLYDMLNEKSKEVHNNIRDISIAGDRLKEARDSALAAAEALEQKEKEASARTEQSGEPKEEAKPKRSSRNTKKTVETESGAEVAAQEPREEDPAGEDTAPTPAKRTRTARTSGAKAPAKKNAAKAEEGAAQEEPKKPAQKRGAKSGGGQSAGEQKASTEYDYSEVTAQVAASAEDGTLERMGNTQFMMGGSKKDAVLALHREGRSNVDIAKTLGLGIGEVKLVIDLFKGQK